MRLLSGLINPLSIFCKVRHPAPLRRISPKHSRRFSSKLPSRTAQSFFVRNLSIPPQSPHFQPRSFIQYHKAFFRSWQNIFNTPSTFTRVSEVAVLVG